MSSRKTPRQPSPLRRMLLLTPLVMLAGCFLQPAAPQSVELRIAFTDESTKAQFEQRLQQYTKDHPTITFKQSVITNGSQGLLSLVEGDLMLDIIVLSDFDFYALADKNVFAGIKELAKTRADPNLNDYIPAALRSFSYHDSLLALPDGVLPMMLYYNRDLFDEAGVTYPDSRWTWTDLRNAAIKLTNTSHQPPIYGLGGDATVDWLPMILQHGARLIDDPQHPQRLMLDDPRVAGALQFYADLIHVDQVTPSYPNMTKGSVSLQLFAGGQIAMLPQFMNARDNHWSFNWGVAPLAREQEQATVALLTGYALNRKSKNIDTVYSTIVALSKMPPYATTVATVPARRSVATSKTYTDLLKEPGKESYAASAEFAYMAGSFPGFVSIGDVIFQEFAAAVSGQLDAVTATQNAQRKAQPLFEQYLKSLQ